MGTVVEKHLGSTISLIYELVCNFAYYCRVLGEILVFFQSSKLTQWSLRHVILTFISDNILCIFGFLKKHGHESQLRKRFANNPEVLSQRLLCFQKICCVLKSSLICYAYELLCTQALSLTAIFTFFQYTHIFVPNHFLYPHQILQCHHLQMAKYICTRMAKISRPTKITTCE